MKGRGEEREELGGCGPRLTPPPRSHGAAPAPRGEQQAGGGAETTESLLLEGATHPSPNTAWQRQPAADTRAR